MTELEPRYLDDDEAARLIGHDKQWLLRDRNKKKLLADGFPWKDPLTHRFDRVAIVAWMNNRISDPHLRSALTSSGGESSAPVASNACLGGERSGIGAETDWQAAGRAGARALLGDAA